jgi:hypothetical protein
VPKILNPTVLQKREMDTTTEVVTEMAIEAEIEVEEEGVVKEVEGVHEKFWLIFHMCQLLWLFCH